MFEYLIYLVMSGTTRHDTTPLPSSLAAPAISPSYTHSLQLALATRPDNTVSDTNKLIQAFTLFEMHRRLTQQAEPIMIDTTFVHDKFDIPL